MFASYDFRSKKLVANFGITRYIFMTNAKTRTVGISKILGNSQLQGIPDHLIHKGHA